MSPFLAQATAIATALLPIAAVFIGLALLTKQRRAFVDAWRARREVVTNVGLVVVNYVLLAPLMLIPAMAVQSVLPVPAELTELWNSIPQVGALALAIVLVELSGYCRHRFEHLPGVWRFHATHHADEALNWMSVLRKHPVSKFFEVVVDTLPLMLLGAPAWVIVVAQLVRSWWGHFIHADLPWTLGPFGTVLMSPAAHRLHHIRDEALMGSNYGNMLTLWDRMFGTWRDPAPHLNCPTGIEEGTRGVWGELARPWEARYRTGVSETANEPRIA